MRLIAAFIALVSALVIVDGVPTKAASPRDAIVGATAETEPVAHSAAAANDTAIWVDAGQRRRSMVLGTDQKGALETYDLSGRRVQRLTGTFPTGVDVRGNLVVTADNKARALRVYTVNPQTRRLRQRAVVPTTIEPFGLCLYHSKRTGKLYAFPNSITGLVEQWELGSHGEHVTAKAVRKFKVGTRLEGCVADDETGALYVSEQRFGLWRYMAEPGAGLKRTLVDRAKTRWGGLNGHVTASIEGLAVAGNRLYVSSQGSTDFAVYSRRRNVYLGRFRVSGSSEIDGCQDTLGIDATSRGLGPRFPNGLFVCEDSYNLDGNTVRRENFKLAPLDVTAGLS